MSPRLVRWLLWGLLCVLLPLPYAVIESGRIPALQLAMFAALTVPLAFSDPSLTTRVIAGLFTVQALGWGALLFVAARLLAARLPPAALLALGAGLLLLAGTSVYVAPLSAGPLPTNWLGLWR